MVATKWHSQFVYPGVCMTGEKGDSDAKKFSCALDKKDCAATGTFYRSPREIIEGMGGDIQGTGPGSDCLPDPAKSSTQAIMGMISTVRVGRCASTSDGNVCTGSAAGCVQTSSFVPLDPACRLDDDLTIGSPFYNTKFGKCASSGTCMWDATDCSGGSWLAAAQVPESQACGCEDVKTGACLYDGEYFCAVSADACDAQQAYVNANDLPDGQSCRLTEGGLPRSQGNKDIVPGSTMTQSNGGSGSSSGKDVNVGAIVVGVLGGLALLAVGVLIGRKYRIKKQNSSQAMEKDPTTNPNEGDAEAPQVPSIS